MQVGSVQHSKVSALITISIIVGILLVLLWILYLHISERKKETAFAFLTRKLQQRLVTGNNFKLKKGRFY